MDESLRTLRNRLGMTLRNCLPLLALLFIAGCAEGPMWRSGNLNPWARKQWEEEARIADTLFVKKQRMSDSVATAINGSLDQQESVAKQISEVVHRDPVLLLRLHGVQLIGQLNCPTAISTLENASRDHNSEVRIAAIKAWEKKSADVAVPQLQEMIGSDTHVDVRLAATRALGNFSGERAVQALSLALGDSDPALQLRATESLQRVTGESLGRDVSAWQTYISQLAPTSTSPATDSQPASSMAEGKREFEFRR